MKKILVVEDNEVNQLLVTRYLKREGYAVVLAEDGLNGVQKAMDLSLAELDGSEATRRIKDTPQPPRFR